jgi:hypothetical protein
VGGTGVVPIPAGSLAWTGRVPHVVQSQIGTTVTIHAAGLGFTSVATTGLDMAAAVSAGLSDRTATAGIGIVQALAAGTTQATSGAGLDVHQSVPAGISDAI